LPDRHGNARGNVRDCEALYRRALSDELALAGDVFDHGPLQLGRPFLGQHNVIYTPHDARRTKEANCDTRRGGQKQFLSIEVIWVDGGYCAGGLVDWVGAARRRLRCYGCQLDFGRNLCP